MRTRCFRVDLQSTWPLYRLHWAPGWTGRRLVRSPLISLALDETALSTIPRRILEHVRPRETRLLTALGFCVSTVSAPPDTAVLADQFFLHPGPLKME